MVKCKFIKVTDGKQCTREANPKTGYCTQHWNMIQEGRGTTQPPRPTSPKQATRRGPSLTELPPDVLRTITKNLSVQEVLDKCTIDRRFNQTVCQSLTFWKMFARDRNLPASLYENKSITEIQGALRRYEKPNMTYNISKMAFRNDAGEREAGYDPATDPVYVIQPRAPVQGILNHFKQKQERQYMEFYRRAAKEYPNILTPDEYKRRLDRLLTGLRQGDILKVGLEHPQIFVVRRDQNGQLVVSHTYHDRVTPGGIILSDDMYPLIRMVYILNDQQPLTRESFNHWYHPGDIVVSGFFPDPWVPITRFGSETDPVETHREIRYHVRPPVQEPPEWMPEEEEELEEQVMEFPPHFQGDRGYDPRLYLGLSDEEEPQPEWQDEEEL